MLLITTCNRMRQARASVKNTMSMARICHEFGELRQHDTDSHATMDVRHKDGNGDALMMYSEHHLAVRGCSVHGLA
jgi:hypothetical protein